MRSYIKQYLNLNSLPVLVTLEEWEEWLGSQSKCEKDGSTSATQQSPVPPDYLELASLESVDVEQTYSYFVRGRVSFTKEYNTNLRTLLGRLDSNDLSRVLSQILACETEEELNNLNASDIVSDLEFYVSETLKLILRYEVSSGYDPGDIDVHDEDLEDIDDLETYGLWDKLQDYVDAVIDHRRREIQNP